MKPLLTILSSRRRVFVCSRGQIECARWNTKAYSAREAPNCCFRPAVLIGFCERYPAFIPGTASLPRSSLVMTEVSASNRESGFPSGMAERKAKAEARSVIAKW